VKEKGQSVKKIIIENHKDDIEEHIRVFILAIARKKKCTVRSRRL
jgi:hypothetical protein